MAEGEDVVQAALDRGITPVMLLVDEERVPADDPRLAATAGVAERYAISTRLMGGVSTLAQPPRVIGVFPQSGPHHFRTVAMPPALGVYLAGVADPGNVGTLIRTSAALGAERAGLDPVMDSLRESLEVVEVTIPQGKGAESLNVSAAGAALLAERVRQCSRMPRS